MAPRASSAAGARASAPDEAAGRANRRAARRPDGPSRALAVSMLVLVLPPCGAPSRLARDRLADGPAADTCLGRFRFAWPSGVDLGTSEYALYDTQVRPLTLPGQPPEAAWDAHLERLRADGDVTQVEPFSTDGGLRGVAYRKPSNTLMVDGFASRGGEGLLLRRDLPEGKLPVAQRLLGAIADAWARSPREGFCFGPGAIRLVSRSERARVRLVREGLPDWRLTADTLTVERPAPAEVDLAGLRDWSRAAGTQLRVLREGPRRVAGLDGVELGVAMTLPDGRTLVRLAWSFAGEPRSAQAPRVRVAGQARGEDRASLEAAWEAVLTTLEPIPGGQPAQPGAREPDRRALTDGP